jgi:hypothetical protein
MSHVRDSSVQEIVMEEAPIVQETPTSEKAPITKKTPGIERTSITGKTSVLRRSSRVVPHAASKVDKGLSNETRTKVRPLDKAALFEKILRSKTHKPKIKKSGLTPEEIEEDMLLMGITAASSSKAQAHPPINHKSLMQQSSSSLITPVASTSHQEISGPSNVEGQAKLRQPGKPLHCLQGRMKV